MRPFLVKSQAEILAAAAKYKKSVIGHGKAGAGAGAGEGAEEGDAEEQKMTALEAAMADIVVSKFLNH